MEMKRCLESPDERRTRYLNSEQGEVSDPDEWANLHYGHLDFDAYERMKIGRAHV